MTWKDRYRKNFVLNQCIIALACIVLSWHFQMPLDGSIVFFLVMQLGALLGSMWTTRLVNKFDKANRRGGLKSL